MILAGKHVLITGGTGSLGQVFVRRLLTGEIGLPERITVFSRDEAKQHQMRVQYLNRQSATDDVIYSNFKQMIAFRIGDVRDYSSLLQAVNQADVVIHAAALKQVPTCEYFPTQAVHTNILGAENLVRAISENNTPVQTVVGISTDKACQPINVMGMTKAIMERILIEGNLDVGGKTRIVCVRYGNVIASRGSVVPLFLHQIANGGPVTITDKRMTRFLLSLDQAVDTVFAAIRWAEPGEIFVPIADAAKITDLAAVMIGERDIQMTLTGIRPGEKVHEIMVSEPESFWTIRKGDYYAIRPMLPELNDSPITSPTLDGEYSSKAVTLDHDGLRNMLAKYLETDQESTTL